MLKCYALCHAPCRTCPYSQLKRRTVGSCVIPITSVNSLSMDTGLDSNTLATMVAYGHSRIPVYDGEDRTNIRGFLLVKRLIVINPEDRRVVRSLGIRRSVTTDVHGVCLMMDGMLLCPLHRMLYLSMHTQTTRRETRSAVARFVEPFPTRFVM